MLIIVVSVKGAVDSATTAQASAAEVAEGVTYLQQLENQSTADVETQISDMHKQAIIQKLESAETSAVDDSIDPKDQPVWGMFDNYVILGDSRAVGFYLYGFLEESRVLAEGGSTIADVPGHYDEIKALNPTEIFLCYGLNDISIGYWNLADEYTAALGDTIKGLKEQCPNATVYVSSILPAHDPAFERSEKWRNIPDWNVTIKAYCEQNSIPYIDNTAICDEHADWWDEDGIHVYTDFYPYWANNMIAAVAEHEKQQ